MTNSTALLIESVDALWNDFVAAPEAAMGEIPVVHIAEVLPVTKGSGAQCSTNYKPIFEISNWVDREQVAGLGERTVLAPRGPAPSVPLQQSAPVPSQPPASAPRQAATE